MSSIWWWPGPPYIPTVPAPEIANGGDTNPYRRHKDAAKIIKTATHMHNLVASIYQVLRDGIVYTIRNFTDHDGRHLAML